MARREYPVGKAQRMVLEALGISAASFGEAKAKFERLGIIVGSKRDGRDTVPVVTVKNRVSGDFGPGGDGESYQQYEDLDVGPIAQWIAE